MVAQERRSFPRVHDEELKLKLKVGEYDSVTHTLNLSASGAYCKVDKEIALMSRVKLALMFPEGISERSIDVEGVVVRAHPVLIDGSVKHYDVAIFFDNLPAKHRQLIQEYIESKKR
jgi:hypothetical protein